MSEPVQALVAAYNLTCPACGHPIEWPDSALMTCPPDPHALEPQVVDCHCGARVRCRFWTRQG